MRFVALALAVILISLAASGCGGSEPTAPVMTPEQTFAGIDGNEVLEHTKILSSDVFEGRSPGSKGEDFTVAYIVDQFRKAGLKPGHTNGTFVQNVPLVGITPDSGASLVFKKGGKEQRLKFKDDFVAWTKHVAETASLTDSELVFVGYGVQAPEFSWDDYKGAGSERQDSGYAGRRSAGAGSGRPGNARSQGLRRPRHDLLRTLDV